MGDREGAAPGYSHIVTRLQLVRARAHEWADRGEPWEPRIAEVEEMLSGIQGVAIAAQSAGLIGFTSACLYVCERVEPLLRSGNMPRATLILLAEWSVNSELYLRRPHFPEFVRALVIQLNDSLWGSQLDPLEQDNLIQAMLEPPS